VWAISSAFTAANPVGTRVLLNTGNTNTSPVTTTWDNFVQYNVTQGWGTATTGGSWTNTGGVAADYSVNTPESEGTMHMTSVNVPRLGVIGSSITNSVQTITVQTPRVAAGASVDAGLMSRYVDANNHYIGSIHFKTDSTVELRIAKNVAGTLTTLSSGTIIGTYTLGSRYTMKFQTSGTDLRMKVWRTGRPEPATYTVSITDSSLSAAGALGVRSNLLTGNTNSTPFVINYDSYSYENSATSDLLTLAWDGTVGYNSLGSLKASYINPSTFYTGTGNLGPSSYLVDNGSTTYAILTGLSIGKSYTISARIRQSATCPNVTMHVVDGNYKELATTDVTSTKGANPKATSGGWTTVQVTFTLPPDSLPDIGLRFTTTFAVMVPYAPYNFWVDSILAEAGTVAGSYFDGNFSSPDYQFEKQGTADNRSYYYKDLTNKLSRVNRIIPQYAPLGTTANVLTSQSP